MPGERDLHIGLDGCSAPSRNGRYCLLACFQKKNPYLPCDRQLAEGEGVVGNYFSDEKTFKRSSRIEEFVQSLNGFEARVILNNHNAFGEHDFQLGFGETRRGGNDWKGVSVIFYLCTRGPGGCIETLYSKSKEFEIEDIMNWTPESYPGYVPIEEAKLAQVV